MKDYIIQDWLFKEGDIPAGAQIDPAMGGPPTTDGMTGGPQPEQPPTDPNVGNVDTANQPPEDINNDPPVPDMPDEKPKVEDFEVWRKQFEKESIKGDTQKLVDLLGMVRDKEHLRSYQKKYIEDNWNIQLLRQNANIEKASKDIRRQIKEQLDRNNPATTVVSHITAVLATIPTLNNIFIKLKNYGNLKGDLHRKFIGALTGSLQVGAGSNTEDLMFYDNGSDVNETGYSIAISTRFNADWGDVMLGYWSMKEDDPDRYLSDPEKKRLEDGSPEEKDVLKRRIILESIAKQYELRAFIINVVGDDGTIATLGWDIAGSLRAAYSEGKLVVKTKMSDDSESMITDDGQIIPFMDLDIFYTKETGQQNDDGSPEVEEIPFIEKRNGILYLNADLKTIQDASTAMQGIVLKETPYNGNPSDLKVLSRCIYSAHDLLLRQC